MGYRLGVDLGTTYTSAAVLVGEWPSMVGLGTRAMQVPSVVFLRADGSFLVGEAAERRGFDEPARVAREFKRRLGDEVPLMVGGSPQSPQALQARLLSWVVDTVSERQGERPEQVTLTHPANWGPYKRDLLDQAIRLADLTAVDTCTEPEAAAVLYASRNGWPTGLHRGLRPGRRHVRRRGAAQDGRRVRAARAARRGSSTWAAWTSTRRSSST